MYFLLFMAELVCVYVSTFKNSFTPENIQKVAPVIAFVTFLFFFLAILSSALQR